MEMQQVFVPDRRTVMLGPIHPGSAFQGSLYRLHNYLAPPTVAAVALGIARSALQSAIELAGRKTPNFPSSSIAARPVAQDRLARAKARLDAARAYLLCTLDEVQGYFDDGGEFSPEAALPVLLASCHAVDAAVQRANDVRSDLAPAGGAFYAKASWSVDNCAALRSSERCWVQPLTGPRDRRFTDTSRRDNSLPVIVPRQ
jgi:alkylation response protein AidB-like acyl-CoA dehydrogenase